MLTLPDFKVKQILFVQTEAGRKNRLFFKNENIVFEKDDKLINQASSHRVFAVFVIGDFSFTSGLIRECKKRAVSLFFLKNNFSVYGNLIARAEGNFLLRQKQYLSTSLDDLKIAKFLVSNKIANQLILLAEIIKSKIHLEKIFTYIGDAKNSTELLGLEGVITKTYFQDYFYSIEWSRRLPRVKADIPNYLLDLGYTLLFNFIDSLLQLFGFDTYKGVYHKLFFQRKSLTCDIMEPFRCIIERQLLKSYNLKQINHADFFVKDAKYYLEYKLSQKYCYIFMDAIMFYKEEIYSYIQLYYRVLMNPNKYSFPTFYIKK